MEKGIQPLPQPLAQDRVEPLLPLFTFGDLLDTAFLEKLIQHGVYAEPARLMGYRVEHMAGLAWPVLVASADDSVEGRLYRDLDTEDYRRIDAYEGVGEQLYRRSQVVATVCDDGPQEPVYAYLPTPRTVGRYHR